jgi:hypothetical protein
MFLMSEKILSVVLRGAYMVDSSFIAEIENNIGHSE